MRVSEETWNTIKSRLTRATRSKRQTVSLQTGNKIQDSRLDGAESTLAATI